MANTLDKNQVRATAKGAWLPILAALAPELREAIAKPGKRHVPCPVHGGQDGFRLFPDAAQSGGGICNSCGAKPDGFALLMWLKGWGFPEALAAVAGVLGLSGPHATAVVTRIPAPNPPAANRDGKLKALLSQTLRESVPIHHPDAEPLRRYLNRRGLASNLPDWPGLRFHPGMSYRDEDGKPIGQYPVLLALLENGGKPVTLHRTFLTNDGHKAPVDCPKKMLPVPSDRQLTGAAVRLGQPCLTLGVAEGIETALAIRQATGMTVWPVTTASLLHCFDIPPEVKKLVVWADLDRPSAKTGIQAGLEAANRLAQRAAEWGLEVVIRVPEGNIPEYAKSVDWLDVLNHSGIPAFVQR